MRIRRRLALYGAVVTAIAMVGFGLLLDALATAAAPDDQDAMLAATAREAADSLLAAPPEVFDDRTPLLAVDITSSTDQFVAVVTEDGTVLFTTGLVREDSPPIPSFVVAEARQTGASAAVLDLGVEVRVHAVPFDRPDLGITGAVVAGQPTAFVAEQLAGLRAVIWFSGIVTLIVATSVAWLIGRRALRPLQVLAETTDEIARTGDLSRRLEGTNAKDEVGHLTTSFNEMLDRVAAAQARLETSLDVQRRFVADASHELRSPLTTIRNNAGFLLGHPEADPRDRTEAIADIAAEAERMANLVDDLLELAAADARPERAHRPVELSPLVEAAVNRARRHGVEVTPDVRAESIVFGDFDALARLVWILVHNAMTHGKEPIEITLDESDGGASVTVTDRGVGIPEEDLTRVFERFYRSDPARSPAGAGLGLPIAESITRSHGGGIRLRNREGGGLTATVVLPLAPDES